jgi:thioesterase domain-containing protein
MDEQSRRGDVVDALFTPPCRAMRTLDFVSADVARVAAFLAFVGIAFPSAAWPTFPSGRSRSSSAPLQAIDAIARDYLAEMRNGRPRGPYFLGSLCAGVFIVTIMARRLRESGETVLLLLLLDPPNSVFQSGYLNLTQQQFERSRLRRYGPRRAGRRRPSARPPPQARRAASPRPTRAARRP